MATNKFLIFDENKANLQSDLTYASDSQRINGVVPGQAKSALHNKLFRQVSIMTYALGELIKNRGIQVDDSDPAILVSALSSAITPTGMDAVTVRLEPETQALYGVENVGEAVDSILSNLDYDFQTFVANGTFVVPEGVTKVLLLGCASGADGTSAAVRPNAGEACIFEQFSVTPGQSIPVTVGVGNTVFGSLRTLAKGALAKSNSRAIGGLITLGLDGKSVASYNPPQPPAYPPEFPSQPEDGATFKITYPRFLSELVFTLGTTATSTAGADAAPYPGWGGFFGFGGSAIGYTSGKAGLPGGFGAGGARGGNSDSFTNGSNGMLIVLFRKGE